MLNNKLSAATVVYFSELDMLNALLVSLQLAAAELFKHNGQFVEYYVIDNSSDKAYFSALENLLTDFPANDYLSIELLKSPANLGYGGGNNLVLKRLGSDYHLIINPDVVLQPDSLWRAIDCLEHNLSAVILSPAIIEPKGVVHHVLKTYPDCLTLLLRYLGNQWLSNRFSLRLNRYQCTHIGDDVNDSAELAGGCFMLVRTAVFQQLKGFDDHFFMYFEDYDFSIRARGAGKIIFDPAIKISHAGGKVGRKNFRHHVFFATSAIKFFSRYGWRLW